jgi:hypothetical protein
MGGTLETLELEPSSTEITANHAGGKARANNARQTMLCDFFAERAFLHPLETPAARGGSGGMRTLTH